MKLCLLALVALWCSVSKGQKSKALNVEKLNLLLQQIDDSWNGNTDRKPGENFQNLKICGRTYARNTKTCKLPMFGVMCFNYCAFKGHQLMLRCEDRGGVDWCHKSANFENLLLQKARDKQQAKVIVRATLDHCFKSAVCDQPGDGFLDSALSSSSAYKTTGPPTRTKNPPPSSKQLPKRPVQPTQMPSKATVFPKKPVRVTRRPKNFEWPRWGTPFTFFVKTTTEPITTVPTTTTEQTTTSESSTPATTTITTEATTVSTTTSTITTTATEASMKARPRAKTPFAPKGISVYTRKRLTLPTMPPYWTWTPYNRKLPTWPPVRTTPTRPPTTETTTLDSAGVDDDLFETSWFSGKFQPGRWFSSIHLFTGRKR